MNRKALVLGGLGLAGAALALSRASKDTKEPPAPVGPSKPPQWGTVEAAFPSRGRREPVCDPKIQPRPFLPGPPARLPCGPVRCALPPGQPGPYPFAGRAIVEALRERDEQIAPVERDAEILAWARAGNLTVKWSPLMLPSGLEVAVTPDMVQIGGVRLCGSMVTAQHLADLFGALLPTAGIVQAFHKAAVDAAGDAPLLNPYPAGHCLPNNQWCNPGGGIGPWLEHQDRIQFGLESRTATASLITGAGPLVDTTGKDYVLGPYVVENPTRCAIFGWYRTPLDHGKPTGIGTPTQSPVDGGSGGHELSYFDYSHRIMLVHRRARLAGQVVDLARVYLERSQLVSRSGKPERIPNRHPAVAPMAPL